MRVRLLKQVNIYDYSAIILHKTVNVNSLSGLYRIRDGGGIDMPRSNEKDAYFFAHDCNARNDPKVLALRSVYGTEGYGLYFMPCCQFAV